MLRCDAWLLEGDKIGATGVNLVGDSNEVLRHQMCLESAVYADRALRGGGEVAML